MLCEEMLGKAHPVDKIFYFTAMVEGAAKRKRQEKYNAALERNAKIEICKGKFSTNKNPKEKQTDANLVARFVYHASKKQCNYAVIVSRDTDFCGAIKFIKEKVPGMIVNVWTVERPPEDLKEAADYCWEITDEKLRKVRQIENKKYCDEVCVKRCSG